MRQTRSCKRDQRELVVTDLQLPVQVCEASPLSLHSHPLGPSGLSPGLVNLKHQSAFVRKA